MDVLISVLKQFVSLGANPAGRVDKLKSIREPTAATQFLNGVSQDSGVLSALSGFIAPTMSQSGNPQFKPQKVVEYCPEGLCGVWHFVAQRPYRDLVDFFEGLNVPMDEPDWMGETPFMKLVTTYNYQPFMGYSDMYKFFKDHSVNIDRPNNRGVTPFLRMVASQDYSRAFHLAEAGADVNVNDKRGNFALKYVVNSGDVEHAKMLLEKFHADPNKRDKKLRSCLHIAINNSSPAIDSTAEMENLLLDLGADVNALDLRGRCPLHYAFVKIGRWDDNSVIDPIETVTTLCSKVEISVDMQDKWGKSPLHYAAQRSSTICTVFLLNRGAKIETKDLYGNTPLAAAFLCNHPDYAITLIERGANVTELVHPEDPSLLPKGFQSDEKPEGEGSDDEDVPQNNNSPQETKKRVRGRFAKRAGGLPRWRQPPNFMNNYPNQFGNRPMIPNAYPQKMGGQQAMPGDTQRTVTGTAQSMFRVGIRMGWQGLLYLLLDKNYDYMLGMEDALSEGKYQLLLNLLKKTAKDEVVQRFNDKQQNLMHILAMHGGAASFAQLEAIYMQFVKRGVKHMAIDVYGRSALHYAVIATNQRMVNLFLNARYDPNVMDALGCTPLTLLVSGRGIENASGILEALMEAGSNLNVRYKEPYLYVPPDPDLKPEEKQNVAAEPEYYTTPLVHLVRYALSKEMSTLNQMIVSFLEKGADATVADTEGRDIFMYLALANDHELLDLILKHTRKFNPKAVDKRGKTAMHYAVRQYEMGSYQNAEMLETLLKSQFDYTVPDTQNLTPLNYAAMQANGKMAAVFQKHGIDVPQTEGPKLAKTCRLAADWPVEVDYEHDAEEYMKTVEELLEKENGKAAAKVDPVGNEGEPLEVVCDDQGAPYDSYMNKVNLCNGTYGEYLFYRMQLIRNTNRDVYIVYTRWGRIGETGMHQKTPFGTKAEAAVEYGKIYKSKTGNVWNPRAEFVRMRKKYVVMAIKSNTLRYRRLIKPFDYKHLQHKSTLEKPVRKLMKAMVNVAAYEKAMSMYGIDYDELPITRLKKSTLLECKAILDKLLVIVSDLETERKKGLQAKADVLENLYGQINDSSSRYYELVPQAAFREFKPPPLATRDAINTQCRVIEDLTNIEAAAKILLGAQSRLADVSPLDYCCKALATQFEAVDRATEEYELIKQYIGRSTKDSADFYNGGRVKIERVFRIQRRGEHEKFEPFADLPNRWLLFHGSRTSNFLGILSQGLRIAPPNTTISGWAFGKGIYFADMFSKSEGYCRTNGAGDGTLFMLVCEVALGKMAGASYAMTKDEKEMPPQGYDSMRAKGSRGPDMEKRLYLEDGAEVPLGEIVNAKGRDNELRPGANEYVIFNPNQVRLRYLIQWSQ